MHPGFGSRFYEKRNVGRQMLTVGIDGDRIFKTQSYRLGKCLSKRKPLSFVHDIIQHTDSRSVVGEDRHRIVRRAIIHHNHLLAGRIL
jgi:hypothetical protein